MRSLRCEATLAALIEAARTGRMPELPLSAHLKMCEACSKRFKAEQALSRNIAFLRITTSGLRSSAGAREALLQQYALKHAKSRSNGWLWAFAAAAALVFGFVALQDRTRNPPRPAPVQTIARTGSSGAANLDAEVLQAQEDGFIAVPYVPPLATGELVSVVHTELYPAALASLGLNVDPTWTSEVSADLLMGEDGFPRAVRVSSDYSYLKGF